MVANPTSQGYEFVWEQVDEEGKDKKSNLKPMFGC